MSIIKNWSPCSVSWTEFSVTHLKREISNHQSVLKAIESNLNSFARMKLEEDQGTGRGDRISNFHFRNLDVLKKNFVSVKSESFLNSIINEVGIEIDQFLAKYTSVSDH